MGSRKPKRTALVCSEGSVESSDERTLEEAPSRCEAAKWRNSIASELRILREKQIWTTTDRSAASTNLVDTKVVLKLKRHEDLLSISKKRFCSKKISKTELRWNVMCLLYIFGSSDWHVIWVGCVVYKSFRPMWLSIFWMDRIEEDDPVFIELPSYLGIHAPENVALCPQKELHG